MDNSTMETREFLRGISRKIHVPILTYIEIEDIPKQFAGEYIYNALKVEGAFVEASEFKTKKEAKEYLGTQGHWRDVVKFLGYSTEGISFINAAEILRESQLMEFYELYIFDIDQYFLNKK